MQLRVRNNSITWKVVANTYGACERQGSERNVSAPPVFEAVTNDASTVLANEALKETAPKKRQSRKKGQSSPTDSMTPISSELPTETFDTTEAPALEPAPKKKSTRRVGQRQPQRDPVGS